MVEHLLIHVTHWLGEFVHLTDRTDFQMNDVNIFIQARTGSSRLPNKVLMEIAYKPMLQHVIERCQKSGFPVFLLTSNREKDNQLALLAKQCGITWVRGSEINVLERFYYASLEHPSRIVVRVTGDCPCVDADLIQQCVEGIVKWDVDYCATPIHLDGLDAEAIRASELRLAWQKAKTSYDKEHVTPWLIRNSRKAYLKVDEKLPYKLSVDTEDELNVVRGIYKRLRPDFTWKDLIALQPLK